MGPAERTAVRHGTSTAAATVPPQRYVQPGDDVHQRRMVLPNGGANVTDQLPGSTPHDVGGSPPPPADQPPARPVSFTERYRGTSYGTPLPPQPPAAAGGGGNRSLVIVGVGILVLAIAAGGAWLAFGRQQALPPPARTADVNALRGQQAIQQFRAWLADTAGVTFHLNLDETISADAFGGILKGDLDVAGPDFSGTIQFTDGKTVKSGDVVLVENIGYARLPGKAWVQSPELVPYQSPDPFGTIDRSQAIYDLGLETRDGQQVHHLRITDWIFGDPAVYLNFESGTLHVTDTKFDIWVTEAGVPVAAQLDADLNAEGFQAELPVTVHTVYTLSNVGGPIVITAPVVSPAPSASTKP